MEYTIVCARDRFESSAITKLVTEVNKRLKEGWVLQGGISTYATYSDYHEHHFASQAMVKYPPNTTINVVSQVITKQKE